MAIPIPCGPLSFLTTWEENIFKISGDVFHRAASTYNRKFKKLGDFNPTETLDGQLMYLCDPGSSLGQAIIHDHVTHPAMDALLLGKAA